MGAVENPLHHPVIQKYSDLMSKPYFGKYIKKSFSTQLKDYNDQQDSYKRHSYRYHGGDRDTFHENSYPTMPDWKYRQMIRERTREAKAVALISLMQDKANAYQHALIDAKAHLGWTYYNDAGVFNSKAKADQALKNLNWDKSPKGIAARKAEAQAKLKRKRAEFGSITNIAKRKAIAKAKLSRFGRHRGPIRKSTRRIYTVPSKAQRNLELDMILEEGLMNIEPQSKVYY
jgi:hypothetical protein